MTRAKGALPFSEPPAIQSATPPAGGVPDCFVVIRVVPLLTQLHHLWVCRPLRGLDLIAPKRTVDETKSIVHPKMLRTNRQAIVLARSHGT
ncbi:MAG: hypothetical protein IKJ29_00455 [Akkermansia sp.]|nr:hypothetical protein [Akkermansia sp.]